MPYFLTNPAKVFSSPADACSLDVCGADDAAACSEACLEDSACCEARSDDEAAAMLELSAARDTDADELAAASLETAAALDEDSLAAFKLAADLDAALELANFELEIERDLALLDFTILSDRVFEADELSSADFLLLQAPKTNDMPNAIVTNAIFFIYIFSFDPHYFFINGVFLCHFF